MSATILIVDDSRTVRAMIRIALEADRHHVLEAADGRAGLAMLAQGVPDLVITDVNMPEMDGLSLVREARQRPESSGVPMLVLTTEASDAMKERGRQAGATGWIVKPFQADQLREVVQRVLGKNVA
jgi:two-component system chemotaxis response regulator CheY